jgi:hypothetical protein
MIRNAIAVGAVAIVCIHGFALRAAHAQVETAMTVLTAVHDYNKKQEAEAQERQFRAEVLGKLNLISSQILQLGTQLRELGVGLTGKLDLIQNSAAEASIMAPVKLSADNSSNIKTSNRAHEFADRINTAVYQVFENREIAKDSMIIPAAIALYAAIPLQRQADPGPDARRRVCTRYIEYFKQALDPNNPKGLPAARARSKAIIDTIDARWKKIPISKLEVGGYIVRPSAPGMGAVAIPVQVYVTGSQEMPTFSAYINHPVQPVREWHYPASSFKYLFANRLQDDLLQIFNDPKKVPDVAEHHGTYNPAYNAESEEKWAAYVRDEALKAAHSLVIKDAITQRLMNLEEAEKVAIGAIRYCEYQKTI